MRRRRVAGKHMPTVTLTLGILLGLLRRLNTSRCPVDKHLQNLTNCDVTSQSGIDQPT